MSHDRATNGTVGSGAGAGAGNQTGPGQVVPRWDTPGSQEADRRREDPSTGCVVSLKRTLAETRKALGCIRAVASYARPYRYRLLLLALLSPARSLSALLTPVVMQLLIDRAYPARDFRLLGWLCAAILAIGLLTDATGVVSGYLSTYIRNMLHYRLSLRLFDAMTRMSAAYREEHGSGMFLERATRDVASIVQCVTQLVPQIMAIGFTFLAAIVLMMRLSIGVSLIVLAMVPLNYLITIRLTGRVVALHVAGRTISERLTTFTSETIEGATLARAFSLTRLRRRKFGRLLRERLSTGFAAWRTAAFWNQLGSLLATVWTMLLLSGGWYLVFTDRLQLGQAVALGMYISVLSRPFQELGQLYQSLLPDAVSAQRVLEILEGCQSAVPTRTLRRLTTPPQHLELRRLSFGYREERSCLHDIDLSLHAGQTVAVVGPSGAGKSTLLRILCGLDDRYRGQFLVDGHDFREVSRYSYIRHTAWVPQTSFFFSESIRDNLPGSGSLPDARLQEYAARLGLDQVIAATPEGYETRLGWEGVRFSAGQYQKLAVLRALLKNAAILLLDEVTASMDIESERGLLQGIVSLRSADCLTLLVTHHIGVTTEPWIQHVIVLADGAIVERGSPAELWANGGLYHQWLTLSRAGGNGAGASKTV